MTSVWATADSLVRRVHQLHAGAWAQHLANAVLLVGHVVVVVVVLEVGHTERSDVNLQRERPGDEDAAIRCVGRLWLRTVLRLLRCGNSCW